MIARSRLSQTMSRRADSRTDEHNMSLVDGSASTYRVPERVQVPRSGPERGAAEHRRVTEALINALEEASAAPAAPASPRRTYEKLQFDWPDVTPSELDCLRQAVLKDLPAALALFPVTTNLVSAIEEGAQVHARAQHASSPGKSTSLQQQVESAEQRAVRLAYQRLAAAILTCVLQLLQMPDDYAASRLRQLAVPVSALAVGEADVWQADGDGDGDGSAHVVDGAPLGNDRDHDGSESSDWEDLPHPPSTIPCHKTTHDTASHATDVGEKLSWLLSRFGWNMLDLPGVWSETNLTGVALRSLRAAGNGRAAWVPHVCRMLSDRWCSSPEAAMDPLLPDVLKLLVAHTCGHDVPDGMSPLWMLATLSAESQNLASAAAWPQLHACLEHVIAPLAEQLTVLSQEQHAPRIADESASLGCVLACYALNAPGGMDIGEPLLRYGVLRSAAVLLTRAGVPQALRRGVLLAVVRCSFSSAAGSFVASVPGVSESMLSGDASISALWHLACDGKNDAVSRAILAAVQSGHNQGAERLAQTTLTLLLDCMRAATPARPLWHVEDAVHAALLALQLSLRSDSAGTGSVAEPDEFSEADKARVRRASLRRLVKDVLARADGTSRKKD